MLGRMRHELQLFFVALQFLTRLPVPRWVGFESAWLTTCVRHFPLVGAIVGLWGAGVLWLGAQLWPAWVAATLAVGATAWLTCAFHEDGLADTADGLGGSVSRERALDIMKDSRLGAYGAMALMLVLSCKLALLALLGAQLRLMEIAAVLVGAQVISRYTPLWLIRRLAHVGDTARSKSKPLADQISLKALCAATLWTVPAAFLLAWLVSPWCLLAVLVAAALVTLRMSRWLAQRLGGFTGDCLGAVQQITELSVYLAVALVIMGQSRAALAVVA